MAQVHYVFEGPEDYAQCYLFKNKKIIMKAYVFPGQGSQFSGMGKDLYDRYKIARRLFKSANEILGFDITKILFELLKNHSRE